MKHTTALGEAIADNRRRHARYKRAAYLLRAVMLKMFDYEDEYQAAALVDLNSQDAQRKLRRITRARSIIERCRARLAPLTTALAETRRVAFGVG